jgi:hypothetical protein
MASARAHQRAPEPHIQWITVGPSSSGSLVASDPEGPDTLNSRSTRCACVTHPCSSGKSRLSALSVDSRTTGIAGGWLTGHYDAFERF